MNVFPPPSVPPASGPPQYVPVVSPHQVGRPKRRFLKLPLLAWILIAVVALGAVGAGLVVRGNGSESDSPGATGTTDSTTTTTVAESTSVPNITALPATTAEPATTALPITVPATTALPTTQPPTTIRATTTTESYGDSDAASDRVLSSLEYRVYITVMTNSGYTTLSQSDAQALGETICSIADRSTTAQQFLVEVLETLPTSMDTGEAAYQIGAIASVMCADQLKRLDLAG